MSERYRRSEDHLERAERTVPLGAQTFSKSRVQYPVGAAPLFATEGRGARLVDVDGHEYVDLVCGLAAVLLGYRDPDVDRAVSEQLQRGVTFSLSHPIEAEVAELLVERVPCAEQVRFGKNGSDAASAAVRIARAHTGRDHVAVCGYHGWHDWYIGSTSRNRGVPKAVRSLTHSFRYDDASDLERVLAGRDVAAVIMEPINVAEPSPGYLERVRELCTAHGALLVFDEIVTGLRLARGGAQELFGVTPDLAVFGKGLANGLPLSAVTGPEALMRGFEEVFFSTTFGGETLALAAAKAVLEKLDREPVVETLMSRGAALIDGARARIASHGLDEAVHVGGRPAWSFVLFAGSGRYGELELKTLFLQECLARGVLTLGSHNVCYALTDVDVERVLGAYDEVFAILREAIDREDLHARLQCDVLEPLFRVR